MSTKKRVFVTGASSELMRSVIANLNPEEFEIIGLSRNAHQDSNGVSWVIGDIQNAAQYSKELSSCDVIIHAAAITHSKNESDYFTANVLGTERLISASSRIKEQLFVLISSRVAGEISGAYGKSKLEAEKLVSLLKNWLIIRPSEIYGGSKNEGVEKTIQSAIKGGLQLCPVGDESKMYPIHLKDAADSIFQLVFEDKSYNRICYVNGVEGYSFKELLVLIKDKTQSGMTILPVPKWVLELVAVISKWIPFNIGFVPDQVARLYAPKEIGPASSGARSLGSYIDELLETRG